MELVAVHTGPIALENGVRGVRIPHEQNTIDIDGVRLPNGAHTALLTRRYVEVAAANSGIRPGVTTYDAHPYQDIALKSKIMVTAHEGQQRESVLKAAHELAGSFLMPSLTGNHCVDPSCLMQPNVSMELLGDLAMREVPFCDPCVGNLQAAGALHLGTQY